ncbi:MAG: hypothetical protein PsegKO_20980 [Pseudohongiellaceae bacterium]
MTNQAGFDNQSIKTQRKEQACLIVNDCSEAEPETNATATPHVKKTKTLNYQPGDNPSSERGDLE